MNIIILGPQGSGKGTQAELLSGKFGLFYFDTGKFLRKVAKSDREIDEMVNKRGKLLPDEVVNTLVSRYLEEKVPERGGLLFDGYPRSRGQYEFLKKWLHQKGERVTKVIFLEISERESVMRLSARRLSKKTGKIYNLITSPPPSGVGNLIQRPDDKPAAIRKRLALYKKTTEPLIQIFKKEGILIEVDGERPIGVIFEDIIGRLGVGDGKRKNKD